MGDERISVTRGGGNVFADLGLPDPEGLLLKADQTLALRAHLRHRRLSTARAMRLLGATVDEVAALRRGRFDALAAVRVAELFERLPQDARTLASATPAPRR